MKVPFITDDNKPVCTLEMSSMPALDMSFEHAGKHWKVTHVIEGMDSFGVITEYTCTVRKISKRQFEES